MKKNHYWCVFTKRGRALIYTMEDTRKNSISVFLSGYRFGKVWDTDCRDQGFRCVKVQIAEVGK